MTPTTSPTPSEALALAVRALEPLAELVSDKTTDAFHIWPDDSGNWLARDYTWGSQITVDHMRAARTALQSLRQISQPDSGWRPIDEDELRADVRLRCETHGSIRSWALAVGLHDEQVRLFLAGKRPPEPKLLAAINMQRVVKYAFTAPLDLAGDEEPRPVEPAGEDGPTLPHEIVVGSVRFHKGVKLSVFINAATRWYERAKEQAAPNPHAELIEAAVKYREANALQARHGIVQVGGGRLQALNALCRAAERRGEG